MSYKIVLETLMETTEENDQLKAQIKELSHNNKKLSGQLYTYKVEK